MFVQQKQLQPCPAKHPSAEIFIASHVPIGNSLVARRLRGHHLTWLTLMARANKGREPQWSEARRT